MPKSTNDSAVTAKYRVTVTQSKSEESSVVSRMRCIVR